MRFEVHEFRTPEDRLANKMMSDTGASWGTWKERSVADLNGELCVLALDLIVAKGFDSHLVFKELLKIEEFRRAGSRSHYLARVFSTVEDGQTSENLDRWAED